MAPRRKSFHLPIRRLFKRVSTTKKPHRDVAAIVSPESLSQLICEKSIESLFGKEICLDPVDVNEDISSSLSFKCNDSAPSKNTPESIVVEIVDDNETIENEVADDTTTTSSFSSRRESSEECHSISQSNSTCSNQPVTHTPSISRNDVFETGQSVHVLTSHKRHAGKHGVVTKITKKFVFFTAIGTSEKIQIAPKFLQHGKDAERVVADFTTTSPRREHSYHSESISTFVEAASHSTVQTNKASTSRNGVFEVGQSVHVLPLHTRSTQASMESSPKSRRSLFSSQQLVHRRRYKLHQSFCSMAMMPRSRLLQCHWQV
jgi:hypothetical protein